MTKNKIGGIMALTACSALMACTGTQDFGTGNYTVNGLLPDSADNGKTIYITNYDNRRYVDTAVVEGNKFVFEGVADTAMLCRIHVNRGRFMDFILEKGDIVLDFSEKMSPKGTELNEELARINAMESSMEKNYREGMRKALKERTPIKDFKDSFNRQLREEGKKLFAKHNNDAIGYMLLYSSFINILDNEERLEILNSFGPWLKSTERAQDMLKMLEKSHSAKKE